MVFLGFGMVFLGFSKVLKDGNSHGKFLPQGPKKELAS